jgi:hypothetical protein
MVREISAASMRSFIPAAVIVRPSRSTPMWACASKTRVPVGILPRTHAQGAAIAPLVSVPKSSFFVSNRVVAPFYAPPRKPPCNVNRGIAALLNSPGS